MALSFIEPELWAIEVYIAGIRIFNVFGSCDLSLDLDPMTFIYEYDPYCLKIYRMCKYELRTSRLSKVIVRQTDRHAYVQNRPKL